MSLTPHHANRMSELKNLTKKSPKVILPGVRKLAESVILEEFAHIYLTRLYFNDKGIEPVQLSRFDTEVSHRLLALGMLGQGFLIEGDGIFTHREEGDKAAVGIGKLCKREFCNGYSGPIETFTWLSWFLTTLFGKVKMMASDKM